jgi:hypothetical protein
MLLLCDRGASLPVATRRRGAAIEYADFMTTSNQRIARILTKEQRPWGDAVHHEKF